MSEEQDEVVRAIVEAEVEADEHLAALVDRLDVSKKRLKQLARRIYNERVSGKIGKREARLKFIQGFVLLCLAEYSHDISKLKDMTDTHLNTQYEAIKALGRSGKKLSNVRQVRDIDIKSRHSEKAKAGK